MKRKRCFGLILLTLLLWGCGAHNSTPLTAGRRMPRTPTLGAISFPLNGTSEVQLNIRGCRMGLRAHAAHDENVVDSQPERMPWLSYRLHF